MSHLLLNLTTRCNAKCPFCIVYDSLNRPELDMTDAQIFDALQAARSEGATEVGYSGGEPSVHTRIVEIVAHARALGFTHQSMNTNGIRFKDERFCRAILEAGLTDIDFSIHGHTAELHDREVARPGAFAALSQGCAHLRALKATHRFRLSATTVVTRHNHQHLPAICSMLDALGFENKRLKYAYEGDLRHEAIINEVAPYEDVVPSVVAALDQLARGERGFHVTHIPLCLLGDHAAFSRDFERQHTHMVFKNESERGDAAHRFRKDGDACDACVLRNLCTRLDGAYEQYHGRPTLTPFTREDEVTALFARARSRFPRAASLVRRTEELYQRNRDAAPPPPRPLPIVQ